MWNWFSEKVSTLENQVSMYKVHDDSQQRIDLKSMASGLRWYCKNDSEDKGSIQ